MLLLLGLKLLALDKLFKGTKPNHVCLLQLLRCGNVRGKIESQLLSNLVPTIQLLHLI